MEFPTIRKRRLRENSVLRDLVKETRLDLNDLVMPLFVVEGMQGKEEIVSMPGQYRYSITELVEECKKLYDLGIKAVILFGIPENKDEQGTGAWIEKGIIQEREVYIALAEKFRIPFIDLRKQKVTKTTLAAIPRDIVIKHQIMPLSSKDGILVVATLQPDTSTLCEFVLKQAKCQGVRFVLAQPSHLKNVINVLYKKRAKS